MAENFLLIRLKSIGDVILTLPAVNAVRENFPSAKITFLTSKENVPLLQGFRAVDDVIALDRVALKNPLRAAPEFFGLLRKLRAGKFSHVVDWQGYGETAWLARLTGAPQRWGNLYGKGRRWAFTHGGQRNETIHPADWNLELLRQCGLKIGAVKNHFALPAAALNEAKKFYAEQKLVTAKRTLFLQPFTSSPHKNWPLENYLEVARHFCSQGVQVVFGGGPADRERLAAAQSENFPIAAGVPMLVTGGLMQLATLTVGGDTGALHLAVAQGGRVLMLLHKLYPASPSPFQHSDWIIAAPEPDNIASISVTSVIAACERALTP